ncbi:putative quinol monooxygenase [Azotobacter sp. CWF10]
MTICIFASITAKSEHRDDVLQALRLMVVQSRAEPGNLRYDLFIRTDEPAVFDLFELYSDEAAVEAHRQSPHYQSYRIQVAEWVAKPTKIKLSRPVDMAP